MGPTALNSIHSRRWHADKGDTSGLVLKSHSLVPSGSCGYVCGSYGRGTVQAHKEAVASHRGRD